MSNETSVSKIQNDPKYHELVKRRDTLAWTLTAIVLVVYFGFILMVAFAPSFLTEPISSDSVIPVGIPIGVCVMLTACITTGVYIYKANKTFDPLIHEIIKDASK